MFDVHYHLIFGVDDGPSTLEDSLALAEASIAEGVTHIVATPHSNHEYTYSPEINQERLAILSEHLRGRLTLGLGCDFHLSYDNIVDLQEHPRKYTINGKQYLLVEFADSFIPRSITDVLYQIRIAGVTPIITHPERNPVLKENPDRLTEWIQTGCLVQVTAASFFGEFGRKAEAMAFDMVHYNQVNIVASDAHSATRRAPSLGRAHSLLRQKFGQETADRLCIHTPRAVFFGEALPPQPEIANGCPYGRPQKRGLMSRLFGK